MVAKGETGHSILLLAAGWPGCRIVWGCTPYSGRKFVIFMRLRDGSVARIFIQKDLDCRIVTIKDLRSPQGLRPVLGDPDDHPKEPGAPKKR